MEIRNRDIMADDGPIISVSSLLVAASVYGQARVEAAGPILIRGNVREATILSTGGSLTVRGEVAGSGQHKAVLQAQRDVTCGDLRYAVVQTGGDLHLQGRARDSLLMVAGNIYLQESLEIGLIDVQLKVGGGLVSRVAGAAVPEVVQGERLHQRVARQLEASIALQGTPPFDFRSCTILDLSRGGAACRLPAAIADVAIGTVLQVKFALPEKVEPLFAIARVVRVIAPDAVGLAFVQMMERDRQQLTAFCLQMVLSRAHGMLGARNQRKAHDPDLVATSATG